MIDPSSGPFLFDTSAESWLARSEDSPEIGAWIVRYLASHKVHVSAATVVERVRGYGLLGGRAQGLEELRIAYLEQLKSRQVWPIDETIAISAGEIMALVPIPPTSPRRSHRSAESRQDRMVRWRFDAMIAATALVAGLPLIHNNAADFESIRSAIEVSPGRFPKLGPLALIRCDSLA